MFRGISTINLDEKGRLTMPTRYREELQECCNRKLIITVAVNERCGGENGCLWLYPLPEWEEVEKKLAKLSTLNKANKMVMRFMIGNASECEMDNQGRFLLPEKLRKYAAMDKKVILVGQLNKFEIWNEEAWNAGETEWLNGTGLDADLDDDLKSLSF